MDQKLWGFKTSIRRSSGGRKRQKGEEGAIKKGLQTGMSKEKSVNRRQLTLSQSTTPSYTFNQEKNTIGGTNFFEGGGRLQEVPQRYRGKCWLGGGKR